MIPIGAILIRLDNHLGGTLRVYELAGKYWTSYTTLKVFECHTLHESPHRAKALEAIKKRVTIMAPDDSRRPCT